MLIVVVVFLLCWFYFSFNHFIRLSLEIERWKFTSWKQCGSFHIVLSIKIAVVSFFFLEFHRKICSEYKFDRSKIPEAKKTWIFARNGMCPNRIFAVWIVGIRQNFIEKRSLNVDISANISIGSQMPGLFSN